MYLTLHNVNAHEGTGGDFRLGDNNVLVPQRLGRSFQKARDYIITLHNLHLIAFWL